jgi:hypothetical protein
MKKLFIHLTAVAALTTIASMPLHAQDEDQVLGRQLMTEQELQQHRNTMQSLQSQEERQQYQQQHHQRMQERANEQGVSLPQEPGKSGKGLGPQPGKGLKRGQSGGAGSGEGGGRNQ